MMCFPSVSLDSEIVSSVRRDWTQGLSTQKIAQKHKINPCHVWIYCFDMRGLYGHKVLSSDEALKDSEMLKYARQYFPSLFFRNEYGDYKYVGLANAHKKFAEKSKPAHPVRKHRIKAQSPAAQLENPYSESADRLAYAVMKMLASL